MILITGGSGYIGSHALAELLKIGEDVVVLDNLVNSSEIAIENVSKKKCLAISLSNTTPKLPAH